MTCIADLLSQRSRLEAISDSPGLDVELLLCHCLKKPRSYLRAWSEVEVEASAEEQFLQLLSRRVLGEPVAYLLGERGFWSLDLAVSPATLIPRPETELLVEKTLHLLAEQCEVSVLDLGTGTGAIALALASEQPAWQVLGCDVSEEAVALAERNRKALALNNVQLQLSSWFDAIEPAAFDAIVSNPPYIDAEDPHLQKGDVRFEPRSALVADNHGLADIETIIDGAPDYLAASGWLLFEHGYDQGEAVRELLVKAGFNHIFTEQDLAGLDRVTGGQKSMSNNQSPKTNDQKPMTKNQ